MLRSLLFLSFLLVQCSSPSKDTSQAAPSPREREHPTLSLLEFQQDYDVNQLVQWIHGPLIGRDKGSNQLILRFVKNDGSEPTSIRQIKLWPYMSIHGHGGRGTTVIEKIESNAYEVKGFVFTMGGKWELEIRVTLDGIPYALSIDQQV